MSELEKKAETSEKLPGGPACCVWGCVRREPYCFCGPKEWKKSSWEKQRKVHHRET